MSDTRESVAGNGRFMIELHPGEVLRDLCLEPLGLGVGEAAEKLGVTRQHLAEILNGDRAVMPDTARQLEAAFGSSARSWMNMQANYDLEQERRKQTR